MEYRLPYYMTYPMPLVYDDEKMDRRDFEYLKSIYPNLAKKMLPYVEAECDRMEYEGSMIYDEYPDQLQLRMMCSRIYNQAMQEDQGEVEETELEMQYYGGAREKEQLVRDLIQVLLFQELYKRRCDKRHCRKRFY